MTHPCAGKTKHTFATREGRLLESAVQTYSVASVSRDNKLRADDVTGTIGKGLGKASRTASSTPWSTERNESLTLSLSLPLAPLSVSPLSFPVSISISASVCLSLSELMIKTKPAHVAKPPKQTTMLGGCPRASGLSVHSGQGEGCVVAACDLLSLALWGRAQLPLPGHVAVPLLVTYPPCSRVGAHRHPQMGRSKAEPGKGAGQQKREDVGLWSEPREAAHLPVRPPGDQSPLHTH